MENWIKIEEGEFEEEYSMKVSQLNTKRTVDKLTRHFKLGEYKVRFSKKVPNGVAHIWWHAREVQFCIEPSVGLICHELTHSLCYLRYKRSISHGSHKWLYQMGRLIEYCKKNGYWKDEFERWDSLVKKPTSSYA